MVDLSNYVEVKERIRLFYERFPDGRLTTEEVRFAETGEFRILVHAKAYRTADDPHPADGWSWMVLPGTTNFTRGSELENTETSAWGRAIGALGIGIAGSIASANEVRAKERPLGQHDTPPDRPQLERTTNPQDGLIGTIVFSGTQDGQLRETPDGHVLPFRVKSQPNRKGQIALAQGRVALDLASLPEFEGVRVSVWGSYSDESYPKGEQTISYTVLHVDRIKGPDFDLFRKSDDDDGLATEAGEGEARLSAEEQAAMDALPW